MSTLAPSAWSTPTRQCATAMSTRAGRSTITCAGIRRSPRDARGSISLTRRTPRRRRVQPRARSQREEANRGGMPMTTLRALIAAAMVIATFGLAVAKLPAPPPMDEKAKAAAEEKKAKDAAAAEVAKAAQAKAEDRVVARYLAEQKA